MKNALIIMMKNPKIGFVKTRLAKDIGNEKALEIYLKLLEHTKKIVEQIDADIFLFYSDTINRNDLFNHTKYKKYVQCGGDLGTRMDYAFSIPFKNEYKNVVMIGTDCFELQTKHLEEAFEKNTTHDFVFGPAQDGGYYLIAMTKWNRWIFQNKNWSTESLYTETKNEIINHNGNLYELETLNDIDTVEDLMQSNLKYF